ncbi:MAG: ArnT family glycosyltransferase [Deltaproteobacteria bacterium]
MRRRDLPYLALLWGFGLFVYLPGLAHPSLWGWDEAIHAAVARGVYDRFFTPHILVEPFYPMSANEWVNAGVWLHKPPLPFWLGATLMHLFGVSPLGLRLTAALGMLLAGAALFLLLRTVVARPWALLFSGALLALPCAWRMVQGYQFGDVTDTTLAGAVAVSMLLLLRAIETKSDRLAAWTGVAVALGFLCKSALALTPLGVAVVLALSAALGLSDGPRPRQLAFLLLPFFALALPWEIVCAIRWPALNRIETMHTFGHLSGVSVENWIRPVDAIFNEVAEAELSPLPLALPVVAGLWLGIRALRRRETPVLLVALWLWADWSVLTFAKVKVPGVAWSAVPALFFALALAFRDAWRRPALALPLLGTLASPWIAHAWPLIARVREHLPAALVETRSRPGLAEGLAIALAALALGLLIRALGRFGTPARVLFGAAALAGGLWLVVLDVPRAQAKNAAELETQSLYDYSREVGLAIDRAAPKKSVIFLAANRDPPSSFGVQELIFWSGRMVYRRPPDLGAARAHGYEPLLVSPRAEPYRELPGVPAIAWARAYDLGRPSPPPPLPLGMTPLGATSGTTTVIGYAGAKADAHHGRWAFYLHPSGQPGRIPIVFHTRHGDERSAIDPNDSLLGAGALAAAPWFVAPVIGPPPDEVTSIEVLPAPPAAPPPVFRPHWLPLRR